MTGAGRKDVDDDAAHASGGGPAEDPSRWALPADAAVAAGGGVSAAGGSEPGAVAAGAGSPSPATLTGIGPLDKALGALPVDDQVLVQHPEFLAGGAFAAGFLLARLLKVIGG